ncbi:cubilin-like isoform X2 [Argiope bruennichi]|uniref:cubilin-like isoform X2 n=1 Tax=Argiope bruennichi TaxID=94029 RepID=UPI002495A57D|nr:cubilin-like isoform X2 [Argiope bruennichi]
MPNKWLYRIQCLVFIFLGIVASDSDPADPYVNQPRIIVRDGALVIQGAFNKEVKFATSGQGQVKLNEVDLSSARGSGSISMASRLMSRLSSLSNRVTELSDQLNQMEENITTLAAKVNRFVGTGQDRISNRAVRRISSKVNQLQDKVNTLTQLLTENECNSNPCKNGGTCIDTYNGFICNCPPNWEGPTCESDINECARYAGTSLGCQNGATCINTQGGYTCNCPANWFGIHCTQQHDDCSTASHQELCGHGTCVDEKRALPGQPKYRCICDAGWQAGSSGPACTVDIDECNGPVRRCSTNPPVVCINLPGSFHCGPCPAGYTGSGHTCSDINECEMNNGGCSIQPYVQCINTIGSRTCGPCPSGYVGDGAHCSFIGVCNVNRGGCHPLATCVENTAIVGTYRECRCPAGYIGNGEGPNGCTASLGMNCASNPCVSGTCHDVGSSFRCTCNFGFTGTLCDQEEIDMCATNPCQNDGVCSRTPNGFICNCQSGFEGPTCAQRTSSCGGEFVQDNGTLQFPETGITYDHMMSCEWVITVSNTKVVNLTFDYFDLEGGHNCEYDFLQINDGANSARMILNRFCGENLHGRSIVSTHNQVYLWFKSDKTVAHTGFKLNWTAQNPECGGELNISDYGSFNSPGYPGVYPNDRTCAWLVRVPVGKRIQFHFATLQLEVHSNCSYDYVKVYDGASDTDPVIGTYCTSVTPPPLTTSGHSALVVFHSDNSGQYGGFHITYSSQSNVQGCGGLLTTPTGRISSPNFPDVYENNLNCEWLIRIHPDNRLKLTFQEFNLEPHSNCSFDYLEIYSGNSDSAPLLGRYCGWNPPPELFSNTNQLFIRFRTDNSLVHSGFKAEYKTICGGVYSELTGILSSPYYPDSYPAHAQCIYDIRLDPGNLVNVSFHYMDIEAHLDCRYDYLEVRDGDSESSPLIGRICGYRQPENIISTYNSLWMRFETDGSVQNRGFYAEYNAIPIGCGGVFTEPRGLISTPRHPDRYPHSVTCSWHLKAPPGHIVRLTFSSFHLEPDADCQFDYVLVQDMDGTAIGKYCGNRKPPILTSMDSSLFVQFVSDASVARDGFTASYEFLDLKEACGGTYYRESGVIKSPGFPERYPHNAHCIWILKGKAQRQITLNATTFNLEEHNNCRYDYLEIRNGEYETSPLIGKFCGTNILQGIKSHSNVLRLEFKTDNSQSGAGFEIFYDATSTGCGGKLTAPRGSIVSPNYPQPYPYNADCEWLIQVSAGSIISLSIVDIDIEEHRDCRYDYVQVFDGPTENSRQVLRICNNQQSPGTITSSGNSLLIRFRSDFSEVAGGFHLAYQTLCNNNLTSRRGVIESPNFPDTYPHNHNCTWMIQAPPGSNISIAFSHLFLEGGDTCDADYVEVLQMDKEGHQSQLGKYCGDTNRPPGTIQTTTNTAIVRLVTDQSVTREGFRLEWAIKGCGGDIKNKNNFMITSPNYPNGYPMETTCYWHVSYPPGNRIELTIMDLDMEGVPGCHFDYLKVYGGEDRHAPQLLNICSTITAPRTITSHGNQMVVEFTSDASIGRRGFKATIKKTAGGCGGLYTTPEGTIMTPNFPETYNANDECDWLIEVDKSHRVILDFYGFGMPVSVNGTKGYVAIYDGNSSTAPLLLKHWGPKPEDSILSTGHQMLVRLVADGNNVGNGFRAHYKTGCGGRLLADDGGVIQSPHYPDRDLSTPNCSWIIYTADPGERVNLIITHLYIPEMGQNCEFGSLFIYDGDQPDSPLNQQICGTRTPPPILSRGSMMHVFLTTGVFRATYGPASTHCGGSFKSPEGTFGTPGYPNNYDMDTECVWTVEAAVGNRAHLAFETFNLEDSEHCNKDYVEIRENSESGRFIGRYCGNSLPSNLTDAPKLWIKFRSDDVDTQRGFLAHFELKGEVVLNGTEGEIASPGYPDYHHGKEEYKWTVYVPFGMHINVRFTELALTTISPDENCVSQIQIFDGMDDQAPSLGSFCGFQVPEPIISTGNVIYIKYVPYFYHHLGRFHLKWTATTESGIIVNLPETTEEPCWEEVQLNTTDSITVNSPNYPANYPEDIDCTYILRAPYYQHVELNVTDLEMQDWAPACQFDSLRVFYMNDPNMNMWHLHSILCGRLNNVTIVSPTNLMKLNFKTDDHASFKGFHSVAMSKCGSRLVGPTGVLKSEFIHSEFTEMGLFTSVNCEYVITVRSRRTIQLSFDRFNVPSDSICSTNYIMIKNGGSSSSPYLGNGKYCGSSLPANLETSSNELHVQVVISTIANGVPDFEMHYTELSVGCGGYLFLTEDRPNVEITSPNYPNPPVHDTECEWVVTSPAGTRMRMDFDNEFHMSPQCDGDGEVEYLQINDGGTDMAPPLHRFCHNDQPSSVMSTGNAIYARYVTAVENPQAGFKARVQIAVCGGTISTFQATITSPNYPNNYGNSQECVWYLKMKSHYHIYLTLTDLQTPRPPTGQNCTATDYLEIRNVDENGEILGVYCGALNAIQISVPASSAYVKFKTNSAQTDKGFSLSMRGNYEDGCGDYLEGQTGVITSPNYPNALAAARDCTWRISAPEGRRVRLTFQEFNLPRDETTGICLSYLQVYNATYWRQIQSTSADKEKICGNTLPATMDSSSAQLIMNFHTRGLSPGQGFSLTYTTDEESLCGGLLQLPSGVIETPSFSVQNDSYVDCRWRIPDEGTGNQTLVMRFDVVDIPGVLANYCREGVMYFTGRMYLGRVCGNYTTEVLVTSPFLALTIRMVTSLGKPIRGIHGTYNVTNCGGVINGNHGEFSTPGYPNGYPPNAICHWLIKAPPGETVTLTIEDLRMEENCDKDYLMVRNGQYLHAPVVGRFCGTHVPVPISSTGPYLTVIFHTDAYGTAPGVKMHTTEVQRGCGGLIHMTKGNISSPNYPSRYDNNVECKWVIEFVPGYVVKLEFTGRFDIEMDNTCSKDYFMVEEYNEDDSWTQALKICGPVNPEPFISKKNKVRITFHTNENINGDGFHLTYSTACGGNFTEPTGEIFSPNYPDTYDNNINCTYTIGRPFQYISLSFDPYFSIESNSDCVYDYLKIYHSNVTNSTEQGPYCGVEPPAPRTLLGPVTMRFSTDYSFVAHGFKAHYETLNCGSTLTEPTGVISTPKASTEYLKEVDCTWQIVAPSDRVIVLKFSHFDLELNYKCWQDYLEIRDGLDTGPLIGKICGNSTTIIKSTGSLLTLKLHMSSPRTEKGFTAFYHTTYGANQGCGGTLNATSGEIQSLDADSDGFYEPNLDCSWLIQGDEDQVLQITFDRFDLEPSTTDACVYDFVELREDTNPESAVIGRYCGSRIPSSLITSGNRLYILFHSDEKNNKAGFKLRFQSVASPCGPSSLVFTSELKTLTSPNYPNTYPINLRCRWTIIGTQNLTNWHNRQMVQMTLNQLDMPCGGDYIEIQKLNSPFRSYQRRYFPAAKSSSNLIRLCGVTPVHDIIASSGMSITFHSDSVNNAARGFSITYKEASPNRTYTADSGIITNYAFPGRFNNADKYNVTILTSQGKTISAYFYRLELYDPNNGCPQSNLKVYNGANATAPLIGTYCGFNTPPPVFSSGNALFMEINMQHSVGLYYINYMTTDQGRGCGGTIYAEEGLITSPLYPQTYNRNSECLWHVTVPGYHTVKIEFKALHLNSSRGCDSNYVELYDGSSDQISDRVVRYCGADIPGIHISRANEVTIKFKSNANNAGPGFSLTFKTNAFLPDSSLPLIQRHPTEEARTPMNTIIYLN